MLGWRGRIGSIDPSRGEIFTYEFYQIVPKDIVLIQTAVNIKQLTVEELERGLGELDRAAELMAREEVDVLTVGGSPIIALKGVGSDKEISARREAATKIPTICGFTAVVEALQTLSIKKVAVATVYKDEQNKRHKSFLEGSGFEVPNIKGMQIDVPSENAKLPSYASYRLAKEVFLEAPDSDGIYISCSRWQTALNIEKLERDLKVPVVTNSQARIWSCLKRIHVGEVAPGFGRLFETL